MRFRFRQPLRVNKYLHTTRLRVLNALCPSRHGVGAVGLLFRLLRVHLLRFSFAPLPSGQGKASAFLPTSSSWPPCTAVSLPCTLGADGHEALDVGADVMSVDDGPGSRDNVVARVKRELYGLDQQLVARLVLRLRAGGFASTLMDARPAKELSQLLPSPIPLEGTRAPPPSPEMDSGVDAMDVTPDLLPASSVTSLHVFRLPPMPTALPPPPPPLFGRSTPCSPPGLVSPRVPPQVPTEKLVYTMPQLVATHILRLHERGSVRTPGSHPRTPRMRSPLSKSLGP
jgi:hypothetical protein